MKQKPFDFLEEIIAGGFAIVLALIFICLKLWDKISWSWVWVLSPIWMPIVTFIGWLLCMVIGFWLRVRKLRK